MDNERVNKWANDTTEWTGYALMVAGVIAVSSLVISLIPLAVFAIFAMAGLVSMYVLVGIVARVYGSVDR